MINRITAFWLLLCLPAFAWTHGSHSSSANSPLGINLSGEGYYSSEFPFLDMFKTSWGWQTQNSGGTGTNQEASLVLDANGYVTTLAGLGGGTTKVEAVFATNGVQYGTPVPYPAGNYVVTYSGAGTMVYGRDAAGGTFSGTGRDVISISSPSANGISITITATTVGNYLKNIHVVYAPYEALLNSGAYFNPVFIAKIANFRSIRFENWHALFQQNFLGNNYITTQVNWSDRTLTSSAFWTPTQFAPVNGNSVPAEVMIALCNQIVADCYFNMPDVASSGYVTSFATLAHSTLASGLHAYMEVSDETWNPGLAGGAYTRVRDAGQAMFPSDGNAFNANRSYYGFLTATFCQDWKTAWGADSARVICVIGGQAANTYTATQSLSCPDWSGAPCTGYGIGAIAIAPYFGYEDMPVSWTNNSDGGLGNLFTEISSGGCLPINTSGTSWSPLATDVNCATLSSGTILTTAGGTGTPNAYTVTTGLSLTAEPPNGTTIAVVFNQTNTGAATLKADGGNVYPVQWNSMEPVAANQLNLAASFPPYICLSFTRTVPTTNPSTSLPAWIQVTCGNSGGMIAQANSWTATYAALISGSYPGMDLIAYESGQSLVNLGNPQGAGGTSTTCSLYPYGLPLGNECDLIILYINAQRDTRMETATLTALQGWHTNGGNEINYYDGFDPAGQYGSWGAWESVYQPSSQKGTAIQNFITTTPC